MARAFSEAAGAPARDRGRVVAVALLVAALAAIATLAWWELFRDRQPPIAGEIDEDALAARPLCVRGMDAPCRSVETAARLLRQPELVIRDAERTSGGNQGVIALLVEGEGGARAKAKWRAHESASLFSSPAKELAAYRVQALFLEPEDYVVPPVASHCFDLANYREAVFAEAAPLPETSCVLGFLSQWVNDAMTMPEAREAGVWPMPPDGIHDDDPQLFDATRFVEDEAYRRNIAILNVVTHLVHNVDAHAGQFVLYTEPWHVFLVDSSLAFRAIPNPRTLFIQDLSTLRVPAIPRGVAQRLRALERSDVDRLLVLEEHAIDEDGHVRRVEPGEPFDTDSHVRRRGDRLQIGLTRADVRDVWSRVEALQRSLAGGHLGTF